MPMMVPDDEVVDRDALLETVTRRFDPYLLPNVLIEINRACRLWAAGTLRSSIKTLQEVKRGNPLFYWAAAETARHALWCCARPTFDMPLHTARELGPWPALEPLLSWAVDVQLKAPFASASMADWAEKLPSRPINTSMSPLVLPQFRLQRYSGVRAGQALLLYGDAAERRHARDPSFHMAGYQAALHRALGAPLEAFLRALLLMQARAESETPELQHMGLAPVGEPRFDGVLFTEAMPGTGLLAPGAYGAVFRTMAAGPVEMTQWSLDRMRLRAAPGPDDRQPQLEGPNPLLRFPLVKCFSDKDDHCLAPVARLMQEWLYERLIDLLHDHCDSTTFTRDNLASIFEEYVGLMADLGSPVGPGWIPERDLEQGLARGDKVVDWARPLGDHVVLVDAKKCYLEPMASYRWEERDWDTARKSWAKGVKQACLFWDAVKAGRVPALSAAKEKTPVAAVVTHGDLAFHAFRDDWRAEIDAGVADLPVHMPWVVLSLDQWETMMAAWSENDEAWLPAILLRAAASGSSREIHDVKPRGHGPLAKAQVRLIKPIAECVAPELASRLEDMLKDVDE
jgi:hypothetical protein